MARLRQHRTTVRAFHWSAHLEGGIRVARRRHFKLLDRPGTASAEVTSVPYFQFVYPFKTLFTSSYAIRLTRRLHLYRTLFIFNSFLFQR